VHKDDQATCLIHFCILHKYFQASLQIKYKQQNNCLTQGIKISCKNRRSLYIWRRNSNDQKL